MIEKLQNIEIQQFIQDHLHDDPVLLMLQSGKYPHLPIREIADQIKARQRLKKKLPAWVDNPQIIFPAAVSQEQSSSQTTAIYKSKIFSGAKMADLTGGAGVDSFFFSRCFAEVHYVEPDLDLFNIAKYNLQTLGADNIKFFNQTAEEFLEKDDTYDLIYLDPDRRGKNNKKLYAFSDCEPDVIQLQDILLKKASSVLIKTSPMLDIADSIRELKNVEAVHVVAVEGEVKEVLYVIKEIPKEPLKILTVNFLNDDSVQHFGFNFNDEKSVEPPFSSAKKYLYEPNAAILKAGAFKILTRHFNVDKLHPNTHLYTSDKYIKEFPGRIFKINSILPFQKKMLLEALPVKKANITTRNFKNTVEEIRKKTGIKEGGDIYLFATTGIDGKSVIVICEKISE